MGSHGDAENTGGGEERAWGHRASGVAATKQPRATYESGKCECGKVPRAIGMTSRVDGRHMSAYLVIA